MRNFRFLLVSSILLAGVVQLWWFFLRSPLHAETGSDDETEAAERQTGPRPLAQNAAPGNGANAGAPLSRPEPLLDREQTLADVLEEIGDLGAPGNRERVVARMREIEEAKRLEVEREARQRGLPLRLEGPRGRIQQLIGFENGRPVYLSTHNSNAAVSTGADILRDTPYSLDGSGLTVGVWDGGSVRASHQEFASGSRVTVLDGSVSIDHATHVAGTIAAAGVTASARGMAPSIRVDSYDWNGDLSEMTARAAAAPGEPGMLYLSNHSYGFVSGWNFVGGAGSPARTWEWYGNGTTSSDYEHDFGRYHRSSRDSDALAFSAPYFLMFRSAGNDRSDNPTDGQTVALSPGSSSVVSYDASAQPSGDGFYRGGFENIGFDAVAKNVITIGSVSDAVSNGTRDPARAGVSVFSAWGPTDDGRIKPDVVANGETLYSSLNGSNTAYGTFSGTSMATPNALGTAALLVQEYENLFAGGAMRSSTLKALLIHTADDLGNAGPDYKHGWGLVDGVEAVDLLRDHAENPLKTRLTEGLITPASGITYHDFIWDGVSPIRVTLCWTDPAGASTNTNDLRTARLVNDLNLTVIDPEGNEQFPYVMPFVGDWSESALDLPATTGVNMVDNVEQVFLPTPSAPGVYRCAVSFGGTLSGDQQHYSLLISGSANEAPPPPPLAITEVDPANVLPSLVTLDIRGSGFEEGTTVVLSRADRTDIPAESLLLNSSTSLTGQFDLAGAEPGSWSIRATNPDGESFTLTDGLTISGAIWSETFEGDLTGWTTDPLFGSNSWGVTSTKSQSPTQSAFAPGPGVKTTTALTSPSIAVPAGATDLQFRFWHAFNLQSTLDAGRLEFSIDGGTWFDVEATGSGASFASNGYNAVVSSGGFAFFRNDFAGLPAWSGNSNGFIETVVNLTDTAKFAGRNLRARWVLATNGFVVSEGWYIDSISLTGGGDQTNAPPSITSEATSAAAETATDGDGIVFQIVRGQEIAVSVAADDDGGEPALDYTWSGSPLTGGVPPSFGVNGSNGAKDSTALFEVAGDYLLTVTVTDAQGLAASSSVNLRVVATESEVSVTPGSASVTVGGQQAFAAALLDQFGQPFTPQPASFLWELSGGGTIDAEGVVTADAAGDLFVVTATNGSLSGIANLTVNPASASVEISNLSQTFDGSPKPVTVDTVPPGLDVAVTYDASPVIPVEVGSYAVEAVVMDPNFQGSGQAVLVIVAPPDPFGTWALENDLEGDDALPDADPEGDGTVNLLEFATGMNPQANDNLPIEMTRNEDHLDFTYERNKEAGDLVFSVEWTDDLSSPDWSEEGVGDPVVVADNGATERIRVMVPAGAGVERRFVRLEVRGTDPTPDDVP